MFRMLRAKLSWLDVCGWFSHPSSIQQPGHSGRSGARDSGVQAEVVWDHFPCGLSIPSRSASASVALQGAVRTQQQTLQPESW